MYQLNAGFSGHSIAKRAVSVSSCDNDIRKREVRNKKPKDEALGPIKTHNANHVRVSTLQKHIGMMIFTSVDVKWCVTVVEILP